MEVSIKTPLLRYVMLCSLVDSFRFSKGPVMSILYLPTILHIIFQRTLYNLNLTNYRNNIIPYVHFCANETGFKLTSR